MSEDYYLPVTLNSETIPDGLYEEILCAEMKELSLSFTPDGIYVWNEWGEDGCSVIKYDTILEEIDNYGADEESIQHYKGLIAGLSGVLENIRKRLHIAEDKD